MGAICMCEAKVKWDLHECLTFAYGNVKLWEQLRFSHDGPKLNTTEGTSLVNVQSKHCPAYNNHTLNTHKVTCLEKSLLRGDTS